MKFNRVLTAAIRDGQTVADLISWHKRDCVIRDGRTGDIVFQQAGVEVPDSWSDQAVQILAQKYFRRAGVPQVTVPMYPTTFDKILKQHQEAHGADLRVGTFPPKWLWPQVSTNKRPDGGETSARQVFHRLAGAWTYHGWMSALLTDPEDARIFYDECFAALAMQIAAPNSPQWFNTGLWWAYGIGGGESGMWTCDGGVLRLVDDSYSRPQPHACFLTPIDDTLVGPGGIMDAWLREARIFKHGSGSGMNVSVLRAEGEPLSSGGRSSGAMSWLRIGDSAAGAIKSGGTTRRAAVMRIMDVDHPEIEQFINWKSREEHKAASMYVGSAQIDQAMRSDESSSAAESLRSINFLPPQVVDRMTWLMPEVFGIGWEEEAIRSVDGQNSNNSVRVTDAFMRVTQGELSRDRGWALTARTTGEVMRTVDALDLWQQICRAAWACADPGLLFHDTINRWNTCAADGEITTTNPCGEFHFLTGAACNLASIRLTAFLRDDDTFDVERFVHVSRLFTTILDISASMASFPDSVFAEMNYKYRTLGLGYADLGGLLMLMGLPYDSDEGRELAAAITSLMTGVAYATSAEMAREVGAFPRFEANRESFMRVMKQHTNAALNLHIMDTVSEPIIAAASSYWGRVTGATSFRNAQTTLIAPTGTISFVMDCATTGVESEFALRKFKSLAGGGTMTINNPIVEDALERLGYESDEITAILAHVRATGTVEDAPGFNPDDLPVFDCSNPAPGRERALRWQAHVLMLAAIQPHISGAASKTINLPSTASIIDVGNAYKMCWELGVKAVALYRDGCKLSQPLQTAPIEAQNESGVSLVVANSGTGKASGQLARGQSERLPWRRTRGYTQKAKIGEHGQSLFWRVSEYEDGRPGEIFIVLANEGSTLRAFAECLAIEISASLQHGTPVEAVAEKLLFVKFEPSGMVVGHEHVKFATSIADLIARDLLINYCGRLDLSNTAQIADVPLTETPSTVATLVIKDTTSRPTGDACPKCHNEMRRTGTCRTCPNCGFNEGCGG